MRQFTEFSAVLNGLVIAVTAQQERSEYKRSRARWVCGSAPGLSVGDRRFWGRRSLPSICDFSAAAYAQNTPTTPRNPSCTEEVRHPRRLAIVSAALRPCLLQHFCDKPICAGCDKPTQSLNAAGVCRPYVLWGEGNWVPVASPALAQRPIDAAGDGLLPHL